MEDLSQILFSNSIFIFILEIINRAYIEYHSVTLKKVYLSCKGLQSGYECETKSCHVTPPLVL